MPNVLIYQRTTGLILRDGMDGAYDPTTEDYIRWPEATPPDPRVFRVNHNTGDVRPATPQEQADYDAEATDADQWNALDHKKVLRALALVLLTEVNSLRNLHGLQPRTTEQLKTAWLAQYRELVK